MITGLYSTDNNQSLNFDRPVKAVAMDPNFYKHGSGKQFVTGDDKVYDKLFITFISMVVENSLLLATTTFVKLFGIIIEKKYLILSSQHIALFVNTFCQYVMPSVNLFILLTITM